MKYVSRLLLISSLFGVAIGCLPGLGLGGGGGGGCCSAAQPACGNPCAGAGGAAPAPVYAAAPLAPAPFASYPQAPAAPYQQSFNQPQQFGGANAFQPQQPQQFQPVHGGYVGASQGGNYGSIQTGAVSAGGAYLSEPVHQVQPLPLLGQPVAYEKTVVVAPTQQQEQVLNTAQVLTKVMPASAVMDENVVEPAVASPNNIVTSINTQTSYGDEQQTQVQTHQTQPQQHVQHRPAASSSSSSSASSSAEHHPTHQVRVPSSSSSIESNEQRVVPESVIVKEIVQSFETTTPYPKQVALQTIAPFVPQPVQPAQPVPQPIRTVQPQVSQPQPAPQQVNYLAPQVPSVSQHVVETVQPVVKPIQPAPIQPAPLPTAYNVQVSVPEVTQPQTSFVPETKVVPEEERIEATGGSDYDQPSNVPSNIPSNEQATVNELLASLDTASSTPASNLDFNQVTIEPNTNQKPAIIQTEGDDYDAPLNEDRKDVPTAEPTHNVAPSNPQPVAVVPEETAPIIPQPIQPVQPVETYQPQPTSAPVVETTVGYVEPPKQPEVHLQPIAPAVRVEVTTPEPTPTIRFELPIEVHEVVTPQVPLQPEPAIIQTITEEPIVEVTAQVLETSAAPVSQFFENITSREENKEEPTPTQPEPSVPAQTTNGNDYDEEKSVENKVSTETDVVPNLGEYGSKFAKVQGAETKQVSEPIQIETIENANPYGRRYWIF
ncbi:hypothetical protein CAEBREN_12695 [Caenorhabditis brenneri]|uniref:Uncharacterized protein n=1 Tax=Caenorhabditis brenneri TaxID=135651 RepID=G0P2W2_CAEBE|nr:hypothetical protein CAEBREN_12695 [Caenorhabditis brenneri]